MALLTSSCKFMGCEILQQCVCMCVWLTGTERTQRAKNDVAGKFGQEKIWFADFVEKEGCPKPV